MKYAIALGGGGARGAYQIGVYKALKEMNIEITAVLGTSVGAINAAAFTLNKFEEAKKLWEELDYSKIACFEKHNFMNKTNISILEFIREFAYHKGIDISPLKRLLNNFVEEDKLRESEIEFGIVTASISDMKPYVLFEKDIPKGQIVDYILASAALPIFQKQEINGKIFIDGAIYDSVPINELIQRGYKNIIGIEISNLGMRRKYDKNKANIILIKHSESLGKYLEFSKESIKRNIQIGYLDAKKAFGLNYGHKYYLIKEKNNDIEPVTQEELEMLFKPLKTKGEENIRKQILKTLKKHINGKISKENSIIAAMEITAEVLNIDRAKEYTALQLTNEILTIHSQIKRNKRSSMKSMSKYIWQKNKIKFNKRNMQKLFTPYVIKEKDLPSIMMLITLPKLYIANLYIYIMLWRKNKEQGLNEVN